MLHKFALLILGFTVLSMSPANAMALIVDEDANPYIEVPQTSKKVGGRKYRISKPLMQWKDGWLYTTRLENTNRGKLIYFLNEVDCKQKKVRSLYTTTISYDNSIDHISYNFNTDFSSVANSTDIVSQYCDQPRVTLPKYKDMRLSVAPSAGRGKTPLSYFVSQRVGDVITVFSFAKPTSRALTNQYGYSKYNCQTLGSKDLFNLQTTENGEVVQYYAPTNPKWMPKQSFGKDEAKTLRYQKMVSNFCNSK